MWLHTLKDRLPIIDHMVTREVDTKSQPSPSTLFATRLFWLPTGSYLGSAKFTRVFIFDNTPPTKSQPVFYKNEEACVSLQIMLGNGLNLQERRYS